MRSRENKTRILYALNYYRAIQKRISIDLREFGTRERIDSHFKEPILSGGKLTVFDQKAIEEMVDMPSVRQYKNNGYFNSKIM